MDSKAEMKERHKRGQVILSKLFSLSDKELKELLSSKYGQESPLKDILEGKNALITRVIVDEKPSSIRLDFYGSILIDVFGIKFKPYHGPESQLVKFFSTKAENALDVFLNNVE